MHYHLFEPWTTEVVRVSEWDTVRLTDPTQEVRRLVTKELPICIGSAVDVVGVSWRRSNELLVQTRAKCGTRELQRAYIVDPATGRVLATNVEINVAHGIPRL